MADVPAVAEEPARRGRSAPKKDSAKKLAALWKKQLKLLKAKDADKKREGLAFCAQTPQFFREQPEVLPALLALLTRLKVPDIVLEALATCEMLLFPASGGARPEQIPSDGAASSEPGNDEALAEEARANALYMIQSSLGPGAGYEGGQPFIALLTAAAASADVKTKAVKIYGRLLDVVVTQSVMEQTGMPPQSLLSYQTAGNPIAALLSCLESGEANLQFGALSCLGRLLASDCDGRLLAEFLSKGGYPHVLGFGQHAEYRFHTLVLGILDTLSRNATEREQLMTHGALEALDQMMKGVIEGFEAAAAAIMASGPSASTLASEDAAAMDANIPIMCRVFTRIQVGRLLPDNNEQSASPLDVQPTSACFSFIDSMLAVLRKDFGSAMASLTASVISSPPPTTGNAAAVAAAATAALNTAAAAALFPFASERPVVMLNCLGRMVERSEQCKAHAYARQAIGVALDWFKLPGHGALHQVADKLLHQCCADGSWSLDSPRNLPTAKVVFQSSAGPPPLDEDAKESTTANAGIPVESIVTLLESLTAISDGASIFRLVRWLALLVEVPENARALGDHCAPVLLKVLAQSRPQQHLLVGFLAKLLGAIVEASPQALESCSHESLNPVPRLVAYLRQISPEEQTNGQECLGVDHTEAETDFDALLLEWTDEKEELNIFQPMVLTEERHAIDPMVNASQALVAILQGFEVARPTDGAASDFWELYSQREGASNGHQSKPSPAIGTGAAAPSKKRLDTPSVGTTGETTVLSIVCSSRELLELVPYFAGTNPVVCVTLLSLISKLLVLRGGSRVLLELETSKMNALTARIDEEDAKAAPASALTPGQTMWPIDIETCSRSAHASLLRPVMAVLHSFTTSFDEVEAAVRVISILTEDAETNDGKRDESSASVADWFVSCAVASGALGVLVAYLDSVRIPTAPLHASSSSDKLEQFTAQVGKVVMRFCNWGKQKQESTARHDEQEQASQLTTQGEITSDAITNNADVCSFGTLWAQQMLDLRFDIPRFGYSDYSALLLAAEIGQTSIAIALLNAGASAGTISSAGATLLMLATLNRDKVLMDELIRHGADLNAVTTDGRDQTVWLCSVVSSSEAHKLISETYTAAAASTSDSTVDALPLLMALDTIRGSPVAFHDFMRHGMDVNISDANGNFPLHAVLSKAHVRQKLRGIDLCFRYDSRLIGVDSLNTLITALVEVHGADVHKANQLGQTPLHLALLYGHSDAARFLLQHGANPNVLDAHGYLPLHYVCCGFCGAPDGSDNIAVDLIQLLLNASPRYPIVEGKHIDDRKFKTAPEKLALEIEDQLREGLLSITQPRGIVTKLASRDKVVHITSISDGFLPWHMACGAFTHSPSTLPLDDEMAARFVSNGGARCAILMHFMDKCGVDIGKTAHKGLTALHLAIKSSASGCNDGVIEILLTNAQAADKPNGLDINAVHDAATIDSLPPLAISSEVTVVGVDPPDIHGFVSSRSMTSPDEYHILLSNGVHVETVDRQRLRLTDSSTSCNKVSKRYYLFIESCFTALHYALQTSDELSRRLLAIPDLTQKVEGIDIPFLALACAAHRSADVVKPLIGPSANVRVKLPLIALSVNFRTGSSSSAGSRKKHAAALHYAVMYEDIAVTRELVSSSHVNVNVRRSGDGFTPLHLACEIGNMEIIKLLLEHGADVGQESSSSHQDSVTPLLLLVKSGAFANDSVRALVLEKCQDLRLLFGDLAGPVEPTDAEIAPDCEGRREAENGVSEETTCFLVGLEYQNLQLHDRIQQLRAQHRVASDLLARKLEIDLAKLDGVLNVFFELLQSDKLASLSAQQSSASQSTGLDAARIFARLPHPHECFRHYTVRSAWNEAPEDEGNQTKTVMDE